MVNQRNIRAVFAGLLFSVSSLSIVSCAEDLNDNPIFDESNNYHVTKVVDYARDVFFKEEKSPYAYSFRFEEGPKGINVTFYWDDSSIVRTDAEGNKETTFVPAGQWTLPIDNDLLREILN